MPLTLVGIAATIRCRYRVQGDRASTESFPLSEGPNPQETTTAAPRCNPLAASQPSGQPPLVVVTTPERIPTASANIERGDACIATRPTNWWGCLLVELLRSAKNIPSFSLSPLLYLSLLIRKDGKLQGRGGGRMGPMYREHEGRDSGADKSKFVAERIGTDFSAWMART